LVFSVFHPIFRLKTHITYRPILIPFVVVVGVHRPHYYQLIEECVSQIVLHRNGLDPDFRGHFKMNVEPLLDGLVNKDLLVKMQEENVALEKQVEADRESRIEGFFFGFSFLCDNRQHTVIISRVASSEANGRENGRKGRRNCSAAPPIGCHASQWWELHWVVAAATTTISGSNRRG
jgi:hypothetical protein